jgi:ferritin-like metal-binding protein YciE
MEEKSNQSKRGHIFVGPEKLRVYFINNLNKIYAAKTHLIKHLPEIAEEAHFADLRSAILETLEDVEKQLARMDIIYTMLEADRESGNFSGLSGLIDDAFEDIKLHSKDAELRDLSIAFYLQNIESMEMASFQVLEMAAVKLKNKQIKQLIRENYDEAKADRTLLLLITAKYVTAK